jgi:hypothetical protein
VARRESGRIGRLSRMQQPCDIDEGDKKAEEEHSIPLPIFAVLWRSWLYVAAGRTVPPSIRCSLVLSIISSFCSSPVWRTVFTFSADQRTFPLYS